MAKGKKPEKSWTIKVIKGKYYLYTWKYNKEASRTAREQMKEDRNDPKVLAEKAKDGSFDSLENLSKASRYTWTSLGRWDLDNPSDKLRKFIAERPNQIAKINAYIAEREAMNNGTSA